MVSKMNEVKTIVFNQHGDVRGFLTAIEGSKDIPFDIKRIFYIYGAESGAVRGSHSNRRTRFVIISLNGKCKIRVADGCDNERIYELNHPNEGLYIPEMIWKDMYDFSNDCVLLVLASAEYDAAEYIRNFEDLKKEMIIS